MHAKPGNWEVIVRRAADIGQAVHATRSEQGLTQDALGMLTGVHRNRIQEIERGRETERLRLVLSILDELGLELLIRPRDAHRGATP